MLCKHSSILFVSLFLSATAVSANTLNFIGGRVPLAGSKSAITIHGEGSCLYHKQSPATLSIGGGQAQPLMVPGTPGGATRLPTPSSLADTNTVFGAFVTIPLSRNSNKNCDEFYEVQRYRAKLKLANEMYSAGQITEEQLKVVTKKAFTLLD